MKKKRNFILFLILTTSFAASSLFADSDTQVEAQKQLAINRVMRTRFQKELVTAQLEAKEKMTFTLERKLANLEYKIKGLDDDNARLLGLLDRNKQALEFMKDILFKKTSDNKKNPPSIPMAKEAPLLQSTPRLTTDELHEQALVLVSQNKLEEAIKKYTEIVIADPDDDEAYMLMGHTYMMLDQYSKAEAAFYNAAHIDKNNLQAITPFYENMTLNNPNDDRSYALLGYAHLIVGEFPQAKDAFENAIHINPQNTLALKGLELTNQ